MKTHISITLAFLIINLLTIISHAQPTWHTLTKSSTQDTVKLWAEKHHCENKKVGESIALNLKELGIVGNYTIINFEKIQKPDSVVVQLPNGKKANKAITGKFKRFASEIWDYTFSNSSESISATPNHPFFSIDRQKYIPISEISIGEKLQSFDESEVTLVSKTKRQTPDFVYNLEVEGVHNYWIGSSTASTEKEMMLVHNEYLDIKFVSVDKKKSMVIISFKTIRIKQKVNFEKSSNITVMRKYEQCPGIIKTNFPQSFYTEMPIQSNVDITWKKMFDMVIQQLNEQEAFEKIFEISIYMQDVERINDLLKAKGLPYSEFDNILNKEFMVDNSGRYFKEFFKTRKFSYYTLINDKIYFFHKSITQNEMNQFREIYKPKIPILTY